ncbi:MAG: amidohydrolase [Deltaproteobacteria bacterium]|nr:amidohydrolase [Deltaproteobacteria bacterium]
MNSMKRGIFFSSLISITLLFVCCATVSEKKASNFICDTIVYNGKIVTVDNKFSIAEAVAIHDGKFLKVGSNAEVRALAGKGTKEIDLKGKMVVPGFIDTHPHMLHVGSGRYTSLSLQGVYSIEEIKRRIADEVKKLKPGEWVKAASIGGPPPALELPGALKEKRWPTRWDLDEVAPNNPVYIPTPWACPHPAILNSAGLKLLGINKKTPSKHRGITIEKDKNGEPNGRLHGIHWYNWNPYLMKIGSLLPKYPNELKIKGLREHINKFNSDGVTAVYESHYMYPEYLELIKEMHAKGDLTMRIYYTEESSPWMPAKIIEKWMKEMPHAMGRGSGNDMIMIGGATVSNDGPTSFGLALINKPYFDAFGRPAKAGLHLSEKEIKKVALAGAKHNIRMNFCVGGDKSTEMTLNALEEVNKEIPIKDRLWVIQHIPYPSKKSIERCENLGLAVTTCSSWDYGRGKEWFKRTFGDNADYYCERTAPFRWFLDAGVIAAQGTDNKEPRPMFTIWQSLKRVAGEDGESVMTPSKKITREEAIRLHTINGAKVMVWDDKLGSIEEGKLADLVILDNDILECPLDEIKDTKVLTTMLGGKVIFEVK